MLWQAISKAEVTNTSHSLHIKGKLAMGHLFCVNCSVPLQIPGYLPEHTGITQTLFLELIGEGTHVKSLCCLLVQDMVQLIFLCSVHGLTGSFILSFILQLCAKISHCFNASGSSFFIQILLHYVRLSEFNLTN